MNWRKQKMVLALSGALVVSAAQTGWADDIRQSMVSPSVQTADQSSDALDQLVAPIGLYPDSLLAQILAASVWPGQVVEADRWVRQNSGLRGTELAEAVDQQIWDPGVKALVQVPLILANMDQNLTWSTALGSAYANEPRNVLDAIQTMRQRAMQAGHLKGTPQEIVVVEGDTILLEPPDAATVYLPEYDPWLVYGEPVQVYPDWDPTPGLFVTDSDVLFDLGADIGIFAGWGWGWHHWGADWDRHSVVFNDNPYDSRRQVFADPGRDPEHMAFRRSLGFAGNMGSHPIGLGASAVNGLNRGVLTRSFAAVHGSSGFGGFHGGGHR
jgi:hypothetical protein